MTCIGVLSDSHGRVEITARAVATLVDRGATTIVHLGDVESEAVIDELVGHNAHMVLGNCDWDVRGITEYARAVGINVEHPMGVLDIDDRRIAFTHGHLTTCVQAALDDRVHYLLLGHSHELRDEHIGTTRVINPGALFRASRYTAIVLDPGSDHLEVIDVSDPSP